MSLPGPASTLVCLTHVTAASSSLPHNLQEFVEPTCAILGCAYVHPPAQFADAPEAQGSDVFLCEYEYDASWKRFRKRRYGQDGGADDLAGGGGASCPMTPAGAWLWAVRGRVLWAARALA